MANALEHLLIHRIKDELGLDCANHQMWASLYPKAFSSASPKYIHSKSTHMGERSFDKLLADFADELRDVPNFAALVAFVDTTVAAYRRTKTRRGAQESLRILTARTTGITDPSDPHLMAKRQLLHAISAFVSCSSIGGQPSPLGLAISEHYADAWNGGILHEYEDDADYRGLGFLFASDFKGSFAELLERDFAWKMEDDTCMRQFNSEYDWLQSRFLSGELGSADELKLARTLVTMCIATCLVGPGSFARELGWKPESLPTFTSELYVPSTTHGQAFQLQPIVLLSEDGTSYFTDAKPSTVFGRDDVVHIGRPDGYDSAWLSEGTSLPIQDGYVSRRHAVLQHDKRGWILMDLGSMNGT